MKIFDNHVHLKPESLDFFLDKFRSKGGNALNIVNLTEDCLTLEQFDAKYKETMQIARVLREKDMTVVTTIGPYPVNYMELRRTFGKEVALDILRKAVDCAIRLIEDGKADAIGEVGRPHFEVADEIISESNEVISYIFSVTAERRIPVILHTESLDETGMCNIMKMARKNGKDDLVVKHFSSPMFTNNCGIVPSIPANRKNARLAPWGKKGFFLETDFAGDVSNPNFVLPPDSVPSRVVMLLQEGVDEDAIEESMSYYESFYSLD